MKRFLGSFGVAILLAAAWLAGAVLRSDPVYAAACASRWCYSILIDTDPQDLAGIWMQAPNSSIVPGDSIHTNNTIWVHLNDSPPTTIEMGVASFRRQGLNVYEYYVSINGDPAFPWYQYSAADSITHRFAMMRLASSPTIWSFYLDGVSVYSKDFLVSTAKASTGQTGGEIFLYSGQTLNSSIYTSTFNNYVQELDSSGGTYHPWNNYTYHTDQPCGQPGWTNCLNAQIPSWSVWAWNKAQ